MGYDPDSVWQVRAAGISAQADDDHVIPGQGECGCFATHPTVEGEVPVEGHADRRACSLLFHDHLDSVVEAITVLLLVPERRADDHDHRIRGWGSTRGP